MYLHFALFVLLNFQIFKKIREINVFKLVISATTSTCNLLASQIRVNVTRLEIGKFCVI